jgi:hypothetical protein
MVVVSIVRRSHLSESTEAEKISKRRNGMKLITTLLATAALVGGVAVASAQQTPSQKMDEQAGGTNQAVERNPSGAPAGSKTNPSPTVGAGESRPAPGGVTRQNEQSGGANQAIERNPDGTTGGSKTNPSR